MQTELDKDIERFTAAVTAPGQMFETVPTMRRGVEMPAFKNAPPSLAHYFAHFCNEHKDTPFIVDGDLRLTFGEVYDAASHVAHGLAETHGLSRTASVLKLDYYALKKRLESKDSDSAPLSGSVIVTVVVRKRRSTCARQKCSPSHQPRSTDESLE